MKSAWKLRENTDRVVHGSMDARGVIRFHRVRTCSYREPSMADRQIETPVEVAEKLVLVANLTAEAPTMLCHTCLVTEAL